MPSASTTLRIGRLEFTQTQWVLGIAGFVLLLDQLTKLVVLKVLGYAQEWIVIEGFFKFVHWGNTGAAWSLFKDNNKTLAIISFTALVILFLLRRRLEAGTAIGQVALGLLFGGITGNLCDRLNQSRGHVVDFLYFYTARRGGGEIGFPAFNVADSAICCGIGILFWLSYQKDRQPALLKQ